MFLSCIIWTSYLNIAWLVMTKLAIALATQHMLKMSLPTPGQMTAFSNLLESVVWYSTLAHLSNLKTIIKCIFTKVQTTNMLRYLKNHINVT